MRKRPLKAQQKQFDTVVRMEKLSSREMFLKEEKRMVPVLSEIGFSIRKGEIWGIHGSSLFEIRLFLDIMANIKPYGSGRCTLVGFGMMRRKRIILPHVFYIGNPGMIYNNMNVLEFLMFATAKRTGDTVERQEWIFEYLIRIGLGNISLTPANTLSKEQKAVVILLVGAFSDSPLVVFNFPGYQFDEVLCGAISEIAGLIRESGRTLVIGTQNGDLVEKACTHIAFLKKGRMIYNGTIREFCECYDKILLTIWDKDMESWADRLKTAFPQYLYVISGDSMTIRSRNKGENDPKEIYGKMVKSGFYPQKVDINPKRVKNACDEIMGVYDIQE